MGNEHKYSVRLRKYLSDVLLRMQQQHSDAGVKELRSRVIARRNQARYQSSIPDHAAPEPQATTHDSPLPIVVGEQVSPPPDPDPPQWHNHWPHFRGLPWFVALLVSGATTFTALMWLSTPPPTPNCKTIAAARSDSERLYCANQAARQGNVKALLLALDLVDNWPQNHPLFNQANQLADEWSKSLITVARQRIEQGKLKEAVSLARKVPKSSSVHEEAQNLISEWQSNWQAGETIYAKAQTAINDQKWDQATEQLKFLVQLDSDYWQGRAEDLVAQISIEKQGWEQLQRAEYLVAEDTPESVTEAIQLASQIDPSRQAHKKVKPAIERWSKTLVRIAEEYREIGYFEDAIAAAEKVPVNTAAAPAAQATVQLSKAQALAKDDKLLSYLQAWALAQQIQPEQPSHKQAKTLVTDWENQIQNIGQIQLASFFAQVDQIFAYKLAIDHAQMVTAGQPRRVEAQTLIANWQKQIANFADRQYLARAKQYAITSTIESFKAAIAEAGKIQLGQPLRIAAQTLIAQWTNKVQAIEDQPILDRARALANQGQIEAAIQTASEIPSGRVLYPEAQADIQNWIDQIQRIADRPILDRANALASEGRLSEAITTAAQIGPSRVLYTEAQDQISRWVAQRDAIESEQQTPSSDTEPVETETEAETNLPTESEPADSDLGEDQPSTVENSPPPSQDGAAPSNPDPIPLPAPPQ